jgi:hypothetical protein
MAQNPLTVNDHQLINQQTDQPSYQPAFASYTNFKKFGIIKRTTGTFL